MTSQETAKETELEEDQVMSFGDERPRVIPEVMLADRILEVVAGGVLVGMLIGSVAGYSILPERVPVHFDFSGAPDRWGSRSTVFLLPAIAVFIYGVITVVGRIKPWYWNIPVKVTEENAARVYGASARLLRVIKAETMLLLAILLWLVVASAQRGHIAGGWIPLAGAVVMVATAIAGLVMMRARGRPPAQASSTFSGGG